MTNALDFLNYENIREGHLEFTRADLWKVTFMTKPQCYFPGDEFINKRLTAVQPGLQNSINYIEHDVRGFQLHQGTTQITSGVASMTFVDMSDYAIRHFIEEWKTLIGDRSTRKGSHRSLHTCDIMIEYFDTSRRLTQRIILKACLLIDGTPNEDGGGDAVSTSDVSMQLKYEFGSRQYFTTPA